MDKRRYSIWGIEHCSDHEVELAQVDDNPHVVFEALKEKSLTIKSKHKRVKIAKYTWLHIVENR